MHVEVFRTNVDDQDIAGAIVDMIHKTFDGYQANFDLDDCDRILRVQGIAETIDAVMIINLLQDYGFNAEILDDSVMEWQID